MYALPEREGEGADPGYRRFLTGLGLSRQILIPHFSDLQDEVVDGMRTIREMAYPDSAGRRFLCMDDGGYLLVENGGETLYGEASLLPGRNAHPDLPGGRGFGPDALTKGRFMPGL